MKNTLLAKRYAKAVLENVKDEELNSLYSDVECIKTILKNTTLLKQLESVIVSNLVKGQLIFEVTNHLNHKELWKSLLLLLEKKGRVIHLETIVEEIETMILYKSDKVKVVLKVARELEDMVLQGIREKLGSMLKKEIVFEIRLTPEIIGGFIAETHSFTVDASVSTNLKKFSRNLSTGM